MFGRKPKDEMKEFEQMRQAFRPSDRAAESGPASERADTRRDGPEAPAYPEFQPTTNITLASAGGQRHAAKGTPTPPEKCTSIVSTGSAWQGTLKIEGSVRIDGQLSGEIDARGTVHVSEGAQVNAKVRAAFVIIAGTFQGQVQCSERLEIAPTGRVRAELTTRSLVVHEGAFTEGQIHMVDENPLLAPSEAAANGRAGLPAVVPDLVVVDPPASPEPAS